MILLNFKFPIYKQLVQVLGLVAIYSCVSPLDFRANYSLTQVVISGQVSTIADRNVIHIGITSASERFPEALRGASVTLLDDVGNSYTYQETGPGIYTLENFSGTPGISYHVEVLIADGRRYQSIPEKLPESPGEFDPFYKIEYLEIVDRDGIVKSFYYLNIYVNANFNDPKTSDYLRWNVEEVYLIRPTNFPDPFGMVPPDCFVTKNADQQRITLLDRNEIKVSEIKELLVGAREIDKSFYYKHYITVYQSAITPQSHEYWRKINILANQNGSIFDSPPAEVKGNMFNPVNADEKVLGYFQVINQTYDRFFLLKGDIPFFLSAYCDFDYTRDNSYAPECLDCLSAPNSSLSRPDWF